MINFASSRTASPSIHIVTQEPPRTWLRDAEVAIDAPPDDDTNPRPEARWLPSAQRSGVCGAVSPRVAALPSGGWRLYYTQILPRPGFPSGANDYENSTTRILSAVSNDGVTWTPEPGVRLTPEAGGAGDFRVASGEVVPMADGRMRMYYECNPGSHAATNAIRSAVSDDGLTWTVEPGMRLQSAGSNFASPRVLFLADGRIRLYCLERNRGIVSAVSDDHGTEFVMEPGVRIVPDGVLDALVAFAPEILQVDGGEYVMYYAAYGSPTRASILRAVSHDGLRWLKDATPVLTPGTGWDAAKCSEMCLFPVSQPNGTLVWRMLYEACDGTAPNARGVWRIAGATAAFP